MRDGRSGVTPGHVTVGPDQYGALGSDPVAMRCFGIGEPVDLETLPAGYALGRRDPTGADRPGQQHEVPVEEVDRRDPSAVDVDPDMRGAASGSA